MNIATWKQYLQHHGEDEGFVLLADVQIQTQHSAPTHVQHLDSLYTQVGEHDCSTCMEGRFTPVLRCYPKCRLMLTQNFDISRHLVNGMEGVCAGVVLNPQQSYHMRNIDGVIVKCAFASQVKYVLFEVNNTIIPIKPRKYNSVTATLPPSQNSLHERTTIQFKAMQIPLLLNNATTIYHLSPSCHQSLYVPTWSYTRNWPYLVLS